MAVTVLAAAAALLLLLLLMLLWAAVRAAEWLWWRPWRLERALRAQGLKGTPYRFLFGDLKESFRASMEAKRKPISSSFSNPHDIVPRVSPFLQRSMEQYGKISFTWFGTTPRVTITDAELIREVLANKFGHFEKPKLSSIVRMLATGLANYEGEKWAKHRRILNPAFHVEKLKRMLPAFYTCCSELIDRWDNMVGPNGSCEIDVWPDLQNFTGDVISRTAFGSSFDAGRRIFQLQAEQAQLIIQSSSSIHIPGYRFLPTSCNRRMKETDREIRGILRSIIEKREKAIQNGAAKHEDVLGLLMESNSNEQQGKSSHLRMTTEEVIEECKLFYFAGQETTSVLLTWTMVVLSMHPSWQVRAREEVLEVFGQNKPDNDGLSRLKIVTMILYEVLRLYPPAVVLNRRTYKKMELGGITLPEGVLLTLPLIFIHHDPEIWADAKDFKPERFAEGVSKASKNQVAFFSFGWGPRICIGQSFAMTEAKMGLSMILQHFSFELSPSYAHAPYTVITLHPQHGAQLILHKL
ncbi:cytochrome P450 72A15-like isoform X1 [Iris pallida]|uniref:Cytochrome P450 72A15-like isoform X1 n=1 Tax=Iris pallida TaxID=29817 RepID=A0AAX6GWF0_IRIPA|nr:cytochrome P450 72A15-like isoform X1 [Iris pallida]